MQSSVRERKSLFSGQAKGTSKDIDEEIYEDLRNVTFEFGGKTVTVGEAGLMFAYEIKLDMFKVYVIALSENYGAIVFYLPEEMTEKIADRTAELAISFDNYLYRIIEEKAELFKMTNAFVRCGISAEEAVDALANVSVAMRRVTETPIDIRLRSNNWLKLHGYPMRRKKGRKKK